MDFVEAINFAAIISVLWSTNEIIMIMITIQMFGGVSKIKIMLNHVRDKQFDLIIELVVEKNLKEGIALFIPEVILCVHFQLIYY